jgi:AcrR family transcriptional regulator
VSRILAAVKLGDPRAVRSRSAILAAARSLLDESGPAAVTHQRVAARAGVGRATVYRHWQEPEHLLQEVMAGAPFPFFAELDGPLRTWLRRELRGLADEMAMPGIARIGVTLIHQAQWDEAARTRLDRLMKTIADRLDTAFRAAAARGEVEPLTEPSEITARLVGPVFYRTLVQGSPVSDALLDTLVADLTPRPSC